MLSSPQLLNQSTYNPLLTENNYWGPSRVGNSGTQVFISLTNDTCKAPFKSFKSCLENKKKISKWKSIFQLFSRLLLLPFITSHHFVFLHDIVSIDNIIFLDTLFLNNKVQHFILLSSTVLRGIFGLKGTVLAKRAELTKPQQRPQEEKEQLSS